MASRSSATARQVWWASVPVWSIGFLSPVPFLVYALIYRARRDWLVFAGVGRGEAGQTLEAAAANQVGT